MVELVNGDEIVTKANADELARLIYSSAPSLLDFVFLGRLDALAFIRNALLEPEGQYSAKRHKLAMQDSRIIGSISLWHSELPSRFQDATLASLQKYLRPNVALHVIKVNPFLVKLFPAPQDNELCFGHLAVDPEYQGIGVASKLIAFAIRQAKAMGKDKVVLDVHSENEAALTFYQKWDFLKVQSSMFVLTDESYWRMQKLL